MRNRKIWKCDCGNRDKTKIITAPDREVICSRCGTVLGKVTIEIKEKFQAESWSEEEDLCRKILEDHVSQKGWEF